MKKFRYMLLVIISLLAMCALVACGGGGGDEPNVSDDPVEEQGSFSLSTQSIDIFSTDDPMTGEQILALDSVDITGYYSTSTSGSNVSEDMIDFDFSQVDTTVAGSYNATATYKGSTATLSVYVSEPQLMDIEIDVSGAKTQFDYAEQFSSDGLKVLLRYSNGTVETVSDPSALTIDSASYTAEHHFTTEQFYTIFVYYEGRTLSYEVSVDREPPEKVLGIKAYYTPSFSGEGDEYTNEYGRELNINDFYFCYLVQPYGSDTTLEWSYPPEGVTARPLTILDDGGYTAEHGIEQDVTYDVTVKSGEYTDTVTITVEKAPARLLSVVITGLSYDGAPTIEVPYGFDILNIDYLSSLKMQLNYSYGDPISVSVNEVYPLDDFYLVDTDYNCLIPDTYHFDLYYKGIRAESIAGYEHACSHTSPQYGFDVTVRPEDVSLGGVNKEYLYVPATSSHRTSFPRGEAVDLAILKDSLTVRGVDYDGSIFTLEENEFELTVDSDSLTIFNNNHSTLVITDGVITDVYPATPLTVTVSLTELGRYNRIGINNNFDAFPSITYSVYRTADKLITSITPIDGFSATTEYSATGYSPAILAGLQVLVAYHNGTEEIKTFAEDGSLDGITVTGIDLGLNRFSLPDEMFEGGHLADAQINFQYSVFAKDGKKPTVAASEKSFDLASTLTKAITVTKTPEIQNVYIDFVNSQFEIFYNYGDTLDTDGMVIYAQYDYSKKAHTLLSADDYLVNVSSTGGGIISNGVFITDEEGRTFSATAQVKYAVDGVLNPDHEVTINSSQNSAKAKFNLYLLPDGYSLKNDGFYSFEEITLDKDKYVVAIDDSVDFGAVTFDATFIKDKNPEIILADVKVPVTFTTDVIDGEIRTIARGNGFSVIDVTSTNIGQDFVYEDKPFGDGNAIFDLLYSRWCSEKMTNPDPSGINVIFDDCCGLGVIYQKPGQATDYTTHGGNTISDDYTEPEFDSLSTQFNAFLSHYTLDAMGFAESIHVDTDEYSSFSYFFNKAIGVFNRSTSPIVKNVEHSVADSAVVGINISLPYVLTVGNNPTPSISDAYSLIARLFGYSDVNTFISYVTDLSDIYLNNEERPDAKNHRTLYDGTIYTEDGSFYMPYVFRNETVGASTLALVILNPNGVMSIWFSDFSAVYEIANVQHNVYNPTILGTESDVIIYGRCVLFETPYGVGNLYWQYANESTRDFDIDLSDLDVKQVYELGDRFLSPTGTIHVTENGARVLTSDIGIWLNNSEADSMEQILLGIKLTSDIGDIMNYATPTPFTFSTVGTHTVTVEWVIYSGRRTAVMLTATYDVTVLDDNVHTLLKSYVPDGYDYVDEDMSESIKDPRYVYVNATPFQPTFSQLSGYTYTLVEATTTGEGFSVYEPIPDGIITEAGYYTLRLHDTYGNNAYFYIEARELPDLFHEFSLNGVAVDGYDESTHTYRDTVINVGHADELTVDYVTVGEYDVEITYGDNLAVESGTPIVISGSSVTIYVKIRNGTGEIIDEFFVTAVCRSAINTLSVNGILALRSYTDEEHFSVTLPYDTDGIEITTDLKDGYTVEVTKGGIPYADSLMLVGLNKYVGKIYYLGSLVGTATIDVTVSLPDFFDGLKMDIDGVEYDLSYNCDYPMLSVNILPIKTCKMSFNDYGLVVNLLNLNGEFIHRVDGNPVPLKVGKNVYLMEFIKDKKSYYREIAIYKLADNVLVENNIDLVHDMFTLSVFGRKGVYVGRDEYRIALPIEDIKKATVNDVKINSYGANYNLDPDMPYIISIDKVGYDATAYCYELIVQYGDNSGGVYNVNCYVYLISANPKPVNAEATVTVGTISVDTSEFIEDGYGTFVKTITVPAEGNLAFGILPDNGEVVSIATLYSEYGIPLSTNNVTDTLIYSELSDDLNHPVNLLPVGDREVTVTFSIRSADNLTFKKYALTIAVE